MKPARPAKPSAPGAPPQPAPFPEVALIPARPFPKEALKNPVRFYDLGRVVTPAEQARAKHADAPPHLIAPAVRQALESLTGSGPRQIPAHSDTGQLLAEAIARLRDHANAGDAVAFATLGNLLAEAVADFHEVARKHPDLAAKWGARQATLPAITGKNPAAVADLEQAFELFKTGTASPYRINPEARKGGHPPDVNTPANALAGLLNQHLNHHRAIASHLRPPVPEWASLAATLPELSSATAYLWNRAAWELLLSSVENEAELVKLCKLGDVREDPEADGVGPQVAAIRARLRRAFRTLAAKPARPPRPQK